MTKAPTGSMALKNKCSPHPDWVGTDKEIKRFVISSIEFGYENNIILLLLAWGLTDKEANIFWLLHTQLFKDSVRNYPFFSDEETKSSEFG